MGFGVRGLTTASKFHLGFHEPGGEAEAHDFRPLLLTKLPILATSTAAWSPPGKTVMTGPHRPLDCSVIEFGKRPAENFHDGLLRLIRQKVEVSSLQFGTPKLLGTFRVQNANFLEATRRLNTSWPG